MISVIRIFFISVAGVIFSALTIILSPFDFRGWTTYLTYKAFGRCVLLFCGVKLEKHLKGGFEKEKGYIFVANHLSYLDIPVLMCSLPKNIRFIYKKSLSWIPVFGWSLFLGGYIPIDRKNARSAIESLKKAALKLKKKLSVVIFPEGTRSRTGSTAEFKKGIFMLASFAETDIVPVAISGTEKILKPDSLNITPGRVKVVIDRPVTFSKDKNLLDNIRNTIVDNLKN